MMMNFDGQITQIDEDSGEMPVSNKEHEFVTATVDNPISSFTRPDVRVEHCVISAVKSEVRCTKNISEQNISCHFHVCLRDNNYIVHNGNNVMRCCEYGYSSEESNTEEITTSEEENDNEKDFILSEDSNDPIAIGDEAFSKFPLLCTSDQINQVQWLDSATVGSCEYPNIGLVGADNIPLVSVQEADKLINQLRPEGSHEISILKEFYENNGSLNDVEDDASHHGMIYTYDHHHKKLDLRSALTSESAGNTMMSALPPLKSSVCPIEPSIDIHDYESIAIELDDEFQTPPIGELTSENSVVIEMENISIPDGPMSQDGYIAAQQMYVVPQQNNATTSTTSGGKRLTPVAMICVNESGQRQIVRTRKVSASRMATHPYKVRSPSHQTLNQSRPPTPVSILPSLPTDTHPLEGDIDGYFKEDSSSRESMEEIYERRPIFQTLQTPIRIRPKIRTTDDDEVERRMRELTVDDINRLPIEDVITFLEKLYGGRYEVDGKPIKPPFSYALLVAMAIKSSIHREMVVSDVYKYVTTNFPYYKDASTNGWKNSARHNLSLNKFFEKRPIKKDVNGKKDGSGKGHPWGIVPACEAKVDSSIRNYLIEGLLGKQAKKC